MKLRRIYNIIINDIIYDTSSNFTYISKVLKDIRRTEPKAYIQTCFG